SELVERTHLAALDEIRHARRCFAIASAYAGTAISAGPITELQKVEASTIDPIRLAIGTLVDGCVAEGVAAEVARIASESAADPVVKDALATIARDEATHAELGWSVLAWCLDRRGVRTAVAARVAKLEEQLAPRLPELSAFSAEQLAAHGILDQARIGEIAGAVIANAKLRAMPLLDRGALPRAA
ncbi:MAG: ferritin-like domain-containing protein, partial [Kofleriaceae bacterium]